MTRRNALIGLLFVAVLAGAAGISRFLDSGSHAAELSITVPAPAGPGAEPTELTARLGGQPEAVRFYLLRQESGEVLAFVARDPHSGCDVQWLPDYDAQSLGEPAPGAFKALCSGWVFSRDGRALFGASPRGLDRVAVTLKDHGMKAQLDLSRFILGPCKDEGQAACSPESAPQHASTLPLPIRPRP